MSIAFASMKTFESTTKPVSSWVKRRTYALCWQHRRCRRVYGSFASLRMTKLQMVPPRFSAPAYH